MLFSGLHGRASLRVRLSHATPPRKTKTIPPLAPPLLVTVEAALPPLREGARAVAFVEGETDGVDLELGPDNEERWNMASHMACHMAQQAPAVTLVVLWS